MAWEATVYMDDGTKTDMKISCGSKKSLFTMCQAYYGHCLGKIRNSQGEDAGWRFAKCGSKECIPIIYEIIFNEGEDNGKV